LFVALLQARQGYEAAIGHETAALETLRQTRAVLAQRRRDFEAAHDAYGAERDRRDAFQCALCEDPD
jgi:hypothetical protein